MEHKEQEINNTINNLKENLKDFYKSLGRKRINEINNSISNLENQKNNLLESNETYYAKQIYIIRLHILEIMYNKKLTTQVQLTVITIQLTIIIIIQLCG